MISIQRCSGMEKYSISGCCLALVYEPVEAAPLCFVSSYVHPCCLADIIRITLFMLPFIRAVFRQREPPRLTAMRSGNNRGCNGRGQKETAPSTILTKQFKRLSRLFGALKNIQSGEEGSNNGSRLVVWARTSSIDFHQFLHSFKQGSKNYFRGNHFYTDWLFSPMVSQLDDNISS